MAVSSYLYHSQKPTPESWVKKKHGINYNPCSMNRALLKFTVGDDDDGDPMRNIITQKQVTGLETLCNSLIYNSETSQPYTHFYEALSNLPSFDGLRLSTLQLLISDRISGSDMLLMTNNVLRLNEWYSDSLLSSRKPSSESSSSGSNDKILTLEMGNDWSRNYTESLIRSTEFLVEDLFIPDDAAAATSDDNIAATKHNFVTAVTRRMEEIRKTKSGRNKKHFTSQIWTPEERMDFIEKLTTDELLGPILLKFRGIVNSAVGLRTST